VTLTGSGGCGKTRLALQVAARETENFAGGVRWIELAPLSDPALVPLALASGLGHRDDHGRPWTETLPEQLGDLDLLAVLDNCEQVLDATAAFVTQLLHLLPRLRIIATSREPLGIPGEISWRVPSLDAETAESLFVERARQARAGFDPDAGELAAIRRICTRLDHLPLAIELAAARVRMMQPARIAEALDDRFRLLTGGGRTVMPRQQTLEASVAWSHELLDDQERAVLRRLSVFSGGFTLDAAEAVCGDDLVDTYAVFELVTRLVDKSLVQFDDQWSRYRLLETIRQYASERLVQSGESAGVRDRHLGVFFRLAEEAAPTFVTGEGPATLARLDGEHDNLDAALDWAEASGAHETMLRMVTALALFFELRGHLAEGVHWFTRALEPESPDTSVRARALWGAAHVALYAHDYGTMLQRVPEALALAEATGDTWTQARALNTLGYAEAFLDPSRALATLGRSITLGREIDDPWAVADGLKMLSAALMTQHALDPARATINELRDVAHKLDNLFFRAWCRTGNGFIALYRGDLGTARREFELALDDCHAVGDPATGSIASSWLAEVDSLAGEHEAAARRLDALNRPATPDDFPADEPTVIASATLALRLGDAETALADLEKLSFAEDAFVVPIWAAWSSMLRGAAHIALGNAEAAGDALEAARSHAGPPLDNPWLSAATTYQLGLLARHRGQARESEHLHHEALAVRHQHGFLPGVVDSLEALAQLAADAESSRESARLLAAAAKVRTSKGLPRSPVDVASYDTCVALLRETLGAEDFANACVEGEALTIDEGVAYAARARGERKRPSSGWDALTPMETQVVALASEGLTNPQIAERLFVARGTVKIHLSHIFSKLGVSTRAELASAATRRSEHAKATSAPNAG
jgi:predicted ATPase/DNA-binding NarL/FixJ family response regulator